MLAGNEKFVPIKGEDVVITAGRSTQRFEFRIRFPNHGKNLSCYEEAVTNFVKARNAAIPSITQLLLDSQVTTAASSPPMAAISIQKLYWTPFKLGEGTFANVYKMYHKDTMESFALKVFKRPIVRQKRRTGADMAWPLERWLDDIRREVKLMREQKHVRS